MGWYATAKSAIASLFGVVSGAGSIAGAVEATAKAADDGIHELHDANQRDAGAAAQVAKTVSHETKAQAAALDAAIQSGGGDSTRSLRDGDF